MHLRVNHCTRVFFLLHALYFTKFVKLTLITLTWRTRAPKKYYKFYLSFLYQVKFYRKDSILMNGAGEIKPFHSLNWFYL